MPTASLPERPDLDILRCQAPALQSAVRAGNPAALARASQQHPHGAPLEPASFALAAAQLVVAREYGSASWAGARRLLAEQAPRETLAEPVASLVNASSHKRVRRPPESSGGSPGAPDELTEHRARLLALCLRDLRLSKPSMVEVAGSVVSPPFVPHDGFPPPDSHRPMDMAT
jgi:hypothetical protein